MLTLHDTPDTETFNGMPVHFRAYDHLSANGVKICFERLIPVAETPCYYWVIKESMRYLLLSDVPDAVAKHKRRVSKNAVVRWCQPSRKEALRSLRVRKERHIDRLKMRLETAQVALEKLHSDDCVELDRYDEINCGKIPSHDNYCWEL